MIKEKVITIEHLDDKNIPSVNKGVFYCEAVGFVPIDFDESKTQKPGNLMRVVYVEPHKPPYVAEIETTLEGEQRAVMGLIEAVYNSEDDTCIICNEEGKLIGMEGNRRIGNGSSIIAGPFLYAVSQRTALED